MDDWNNFTPVAPAGVYQSDPEGDQSSGNDDNNLPSSRIDNNTPSGEDSSDNISHGGPTSPASEQAYPSDEDLYVEDDTRVAEEDLALDEVSEDEEVDEEGNTIAPKLHAKLVRLESEDGQEPGEHKRPVKTELSEFWLDKDGPFGRKRDLILKSRGPQTPNGPGPHANPSPEFYDPSIYDIFGQYFRCAQANKLYGEDYDHATDPYAEQIIHLKPIFLYGSLMLPHLLAAALGREKVEDYDDIGLLKIASHLVPAVLQGWNRVCVKGKKWPVAVRPTVGGAAFAPGMSHEETGNPRDLEIHGFLYWKPEGYELDDYHLGAGDDKFGVETVQVMVPTSLHKWRRPNTWDWKSEASSQTGLAEWDYIGDPSWQSIEADIYAPKYGAFEEEEEPYRKWFLEGYLESE